MLILLPCRFRDFLASLMGLLLFVAPSSSSIGLFDRCHVLDPLAGFVGMRLTVVFSTWLSLPCHALVFYPVSNDTARISSLP